MKIIVFTDTHGSPTAYKKLKAKIKKEKPDMLLCCGDFTIFEHDINKIAAKLNKLGPKILMIHGNHEDVTSLNKICKKYKNLVSIHKKSYRRGKILFIGWGGGGFSHKDKPFTKWTKQIKKKFKKDDKIVLLTHAPPYDTKLDIIIDEPCGNKDIRKFIEKTKLVKFAFSGHLHETFNQKQKLGNAKVVNPGPYGWVFNV